MNKEENLRYDREYYARRSPESKLRKQELQANRLKITKDWIKNYLGKHPCVDCGEKDPIVLEFDHVKDKKEWNISDMVRHGFYRANIEFEISKCEVRCANCHRRITYKRRLMYEKSRELVLCIS